MSEEGHALHKKYHKGEVSGPCVLLLRNLNEVEMKLKFSDVLSALVFVTPAETLLVNNVPIQLAVVVLFTEQR